MPEVNLSNPVRDPSVGPNDAAMAALADSVAASNAAGEAAGRAAMAGTVPVPASVVTPTVPAAAPASPAALEIKPPEAAPILGKFKTQADLEKAYTELESKLGKPAAAPQAITEAELADFTTEYSTAGGLSEASLVKLESKGIKRDIVNAYIEGQKAQAQASLQAVYTAVGGEANYKAAAEWAAGALSSAELTSYNATMRSGDSGAIQSAVAGLHARYVVAGGKPAGQAPTRVHGTQTPGQSHVQPFGSADEVVLAMAHPAYKTNPTYREMVARRMAASNTKV